MNVKMVKTAQGVCYIIEDAPKHIDIVDSDLYNSLLDKVAKTEKLQQKIDQLEAVNTYQEERILELMKQNLALAKTIGNLEIVTQAYQVKGYTDCMLDSAYRGDRLEKTNKLAQKLIDVYNSKQAQPLIDSLVSEVNSES